MSSPSTGALMSFLAIVGLLLKVLDGDAGLVGNSGALLNDCFGLLGVVAEDESTSDEANDESDDNVNHFLVLFGEITC
jgi:hypothetical protein